MIVKSDDKPCTTIKDEKDAIKAILPALAMPNSNPLSEFGDLMGKWEQVNSSKVDFI